MSTLLTHPQLFWTERELVRTCEPGVDIPHLATSSTPEEWASKAEALFHNHNYWHAMHCYERASRPREMNVAYAYYLREQAEKTAVTKQGRNTEQLRAFIRAAGAFTTSAEQAVKEKAVYYRIAGKCFEQGGDHARAADAYLRAKEFTLSATHYRRAGMFDDAVKVIKDHRHLVEPRVVDTIFDVSRVYYLREHKLT